MAKIEITLTADYVQSWGLWEGIREIMQNARDGEIEQNAPMHAGITPSGDKLQVENQGVTLPRDALLIGHSTKQKSGNTLGQFGEGLKLGTLALCRLGYPITIYNGDEIWTAGIEKSEKFGRQVLTFHTRKSKAANPKEKLTVSVQGITQEMWDELRGRFLFLQDPDDVIHVPAGSLILDEAYQGCIFVKGIYVANENVRYGYDMPHAEIDRDRRMIRSFELRWEAARIWEQAMTHNEARRRELAEKAFKLLENEAEDVMSMVFHAGEGSPALEALHSAWQERYGEDAYPVGSMSESRELSYYNANGVVCSGALRQTIQKKSGTSEDVKKQLNEAQKVFLSWQDLTEQEKDTLHQAIEMVSEVLPEVSLDIVNVAEFPAQPNTMGYFDPQEGTVNLARGVLEDLAQALHTVAHESAHMVGGDGEAGHTAALGELLSRIAINNLKR